VNRRNFLLARLKAMQAIRKAREQIQQVKNVTDNPSVQTASQPQQAPTPYQPERFGGFNGSGFQP
jgi:hypothetical protein